MSNDTLVKPSATLGFRGVDRNFHLHGFQDQDRLILFEALADLGHDFPDVARDLGLDVDYGHDGPPGLMLLTSTLELLHSSCNSNSYFLATRSGTPVTETSQQTYEGWIGRSETASERIDAWPLRALNAALEINAPVEDGAGIPPLAHWLYFVPLAPRSRVGTDGHPKRGDFLPPITLPRRMWAGSDIVFHGPIAIGDRVEKKSTIADVSVKPGKSGDMIFLKVENAYRVAGALRLAEVQTLVYLDDPKPDAPSPQPKKAPENAAFSDAFSADTVLLFRYSAITFNAHRIHYDAPYARDVEGYPDVVVHGQLTATLLLNAFRRSQSERPVNSFSFRAVKPIFCGSTIVLEGAPDEGGYSLWARDADGHLCVKATVGF